MKMWNLLEPQLVSWGSLITIFLTSDQFLSEGNKMVLMWYLLQRRERERKELRHLTPSDVSALFCQNEPKTWEWKYGIKTYLFTSYRPNMASKRICLLHICRWELQQDSIILIRRNAPRHVIAKVAITKSNTVTWILSEEAFTVKTIESLTQTWYL